MRRLLLILVATALLAEETPWHLGRISHRLRTDPDRSYARGSDGSGVTIYVIDSGTLRHHQEFTTVEDGVNFVAGPLPERAGVPQEPVDYDATPASLPRYCPPNLLLTPFFDDLPGGAVSHGTAVASVAAGRNVGVAPGAKVVPVKVFGCGNDQFRATNAAAFIAALEWVAANAVPPAVVSMSNFHWVNDCSNYAERSCLAGVELQLFEQAVHALTDRGIPVVASANNQGTDACTQTPGRLSYRGGLGKVITVGGLAKDSDTRLPISNFGACVDFWAPAEEIRVAHTSAPDAYRPPSASTGTSFAAPIVAGIIARLMSEDASLHSDVDAVYARLRDSATRADVGLIAYVGGVTFKRHPSVACTDGTTARLEAEALQAATFEWYRGVSGDTSVPVASVSTLTCPGETPSAAIARINVPLGERYWVRARRSELTGDSADVRAGAIRFVAHPRTHWSTRSETTMLRASIEAPAAGSYCTQWLRGDTPVGAPLRHVLTAPGVVEVGHFVDLPAANETVHRARAWAAADCNAPIPADFGTFSDTAQVRHCHPPSIVRQPSQGLTFDLTTSSPRRLDVVVAGSDPAVTWFRGTRGDTSHPMRNPDGSIIRGAAIELTESGSYWAQVGGACGSVDSRAVDVAVCGYSLQGQHDGFGPFHRDAVSYTVPPGQSTRLVAHALDASSAPLAEPLHYVWRHGATLHAGPEPFYDIPGGARGIFSVSTTSGGCTRHLSFLVNDGPAPACRPFQLWAGDCRLSQAPRITYSADGPLHLGAQVADEHGRAFVYRWSDGSTAATTVVDTTGRDAFTIDVTASDPANAACAQTIRIVLVRCGTDATPCLPCPRRRTAR